MILYAPAKINLFLEVLKKRYDNYHEIETVFQTINLYDEISLTLLDKDVIEIYCDIEEISNDKNLAFKAAKLLKEKTQEKKGVKIYIKKNIPICSGLGGGSSDAAAVLLGLLNLWNIKMKFSELLEIGKQIGADVPFFLYGGCCLAKGVGEKLQPVTPFWYRMPLNLIVLIPNLKIYSKDVYSKIELNKIKKRKIEVNLEKETKNIWDKLLFNRLEDVVFKEYVEIKDMKDRLRDFGVKHSLMSGSGPAIFCIINKWHRWENIKKEFPDSRVFNIKTVFPQRQ